MWTLAQALPGTPYDDLDFVPYAIANSLIHCYLYDRGANCVWLIDAESGAKPMEDPLTAELREAAEKLKRSLKKNSLAYRSAS